MSDAPLPKFDNPPVVEVALSIAFEPLDRYRSAHAGRLWERLKDQFPVTDDQGELGIAVEGPGAPALPPRLEMMDKPRIRTWFQSADETQLVQLQFNRIVYNWKRGAASEAYPSYDEVERRFQRLLPTVLDFFESEGLGRIIPNQVEVTYVNHIREPHYQVGRVFTSGRLETGAFLPPVEDLRFLARYLITDDSKNMMGRLSAELQPAYLATTREEILRLNMIARGKPDSPDVDGAFAFLRRGHEWIVRGFAEITTSEMHEKWRRRQ